MKRRLAHCMLLGAALLFLMASCSDEESFTTDRNAVLTFSRDTVFFDTLFTGISSSTERFNVYNRNSEGIRIASVSLASGGTSGFQMNVDGQYGTSVNQVEILKQDSIFIFVEVNVPEQPSNQPTLHEDAIVFTLESGVQQKVILEAYGQNITVLRSEVYEGGTFTLTSDVPYVIYDSLVVAETATLRIEAGATLCFHNDANMIVRGALEVEGTLEKPVTFRGDRTDRLFSYLPYDRLDNQWGGIYLAPSCQGCTLHYADIHSGSFGIISEGISGKLTIENSVIHNVGGSALFLQETHSLVANTQITNSYGDCISIFGGTSDFYHCTVAQFYPWSADRGNALVISNNLDEATPTLVEAANFYNCFITGYAKDEIYGYPGDSPLNIHFYSCTLLTDISDDTYFHNCTAESKDLDCYQATNFRSIDTSTYFYDFHLDSLSTARFKGASQYSALYPLDRDGNLRSETPDAGCYQFLR